MPCTTHIVVCSTRRTVSSVRSFVLRENDSVHASLTSLRPSVNECALNASRKAASTFSASSTAKVIETFSLSLWVARRLRGASNALISPLLMIATRSQSSSTSARLCEVRKTVTRFVSSCASALIVARMRAAASGSSERVGSSSNNTGGSASIARATDKRCLFPVESSAKKRFAELSTGNKQRLSVARAMLADPPVLLLDEPTRSLDPLAAARMRATIKALAQDETKRVTVFLTSHNLAEVEELCDRVAIISKGEIKALDAPRNLRATHSDNENVSITFAVDDAEKVEAALREAFSAHSFTLGRSDVSDAWTLSFSRKTNDRTLDTVLRVLHTTMCVVQGIESERATLLEVLEHYEQPDDNSATTPTSRDSDRARDSTATSNAPKQEKPR